MLTSITTYTEKICHLKICISFKGLCKKGVHDCSVINYYYPNHLGVVTMPEHGSLHGISLFYSGRKLLRSGLTRSFKRAAICFPKPDQKVGQTMTQPCQSMK